MPMSNSVPIAVLVFLFSAAFVLGPDPAPVGDVGAPIRSAPSEMRATRIFHGGPVLTMDDQGNVARALATQGDKIVFVGDERSVLRMLGSDTEVIDLQGRVLVPGFIEAEGQFDTTLAALAGESQPDQLESIQRTWAMQGYTTLQGQLDEDADLERLRRVEQDGRLWLDIAAFTREAVADSTRPTNRSTERAGGRLTLHASQAPIAPASALAETPHVVPGAIDASLYQRLHRLTRAAAIASGEAERKGSLEAGKAADLVVLEARSRAQGDEPAQFAVLETIKSGRTVFRQR